jgi:hypothetical protein
MNRRFNTTSEFEAWRATLPYQAKAQPGGRETPALHVPEPELKYKNKFTVVDGIKFRSRREANRYSELQLLVRAGKISDLRMQVRYPLEVNGLLICYYASDFTYMEGGKLIVEDAKGHITPLYVIKKKMMAAQYGIEIKET